MKNVKNKKFLLSIFVLALFGIMVMANVYAVDYYNFGSATQKADRLEAEAHISATQVDGATTTVCSTNLYDSTDSIQLRNKAALTFTIHVETAGIYVMKYAYFTDTTTARMSVSVNEGVAQDMGAMLPNGLSSTGGGSSNNRMVFFGNFNVGLTAGENTIVIANVTGNTDVDFVEFYKEDALYYYPIERQQLGMQKVGERIEAEWGYPTDASKYTNSIKSSNASGCYVGLGGNNSTAATMNYTVIAEKAGTYYLQICNGGYLTTCKQTWVINGTSEVLTFTYDIAGETSVMPTIHRFEVSLSKGVNTISFTRNTSGVSTDWFKLIEPHATNLDTAIQPEDYSLGVMKLNGKVGKEEAKEIYLGYTYTTVSEDLNGYYTEFHASRPTTVELPVTVSEAGYYDMYLRAYTSSNMTKVGISLDGGDVVAYPVSYTKGLDTGTRTAHNVYRFYLSAGAHTFVFTRNDQYPGMDWLYITRAAIQQESTTLTVEKDAAYSVGLKTSDNFTITDTSVATYANGIITAVKRGNTEAYHQIQMNDKTNYVYSRPYTIEVPKLDVDDTSIFAEQLESLTYNGEVRKRDIKRAAVASAPEGWKVECIFGNGNYKDAGIYDVKVKFIHDDYKTVRKEFKFSILRAEYTGNQLVANNTEFVYNGERQQLVAKAPKGWTIEYVNNGRKNTGSHEVTVYFTHRNYETVEKTATLTIVE